MSFELGKLPPPHSLPRNAVFSFSIKVTHKLKHKHSVTSPKAMHVLYTRYIRSRQHFSTHAGSSGFTSRTNEKRRLPRPSLQLLPFPPHPSNCPPFAHLTLHPSPISLFPTCPWVSFSTLCDSFFSLFFQILRRFP